MKSRKIIYHASDAKMVMQISASPARGGCLQDSWPPGQRGLLSRVRIPRQGLRRTPRPRGKSSTQWPSEMPPGEGSPVASATPTEVLPEDPRRATDLQPSKGGLVGNPPNIPISQKRTKKEKTISYNLTNIT